MRASIQAIRKAELAKARQEAFNLRARAALKWGRRCLYALVLTGLAAAWQSDIYGPVMERQVADAFGSLDTFFGGKGNARDVVIAALSDIRD